MQEGLPLTSSEKLNSVHSKMRDFCKELSKDPFFSESIAVPDTRYSHFDIAAKCVVLEVEGLEAGLRFEDVRSVFEAHNNFSSSSAVAKRIKTALDLLHRAYKNKGSNLKTRTTVQSLITLACRLVSTGNLEGAESEIRDFFESFSDELRVQMELGQAATDTDFMNFQRSVNANVRSGAKLRHQILLRKLFQLSPQLAKRFDVSVIAESGVNGRVVELGKSIMRLIVQINERTASVTGADLFKATNKTSQALVRLGKPVGTYKEYGDMIDDLYFVFRESTGSRLDEPVPISFSDVNALRTDLRHDVDHGDAGKVRSKRKKAGSTFEKYAGAGTPQTVEPMRLSLVQANLLGAVEGDLRALLSKLLTEPKPAIEV